MSRADRLVHHLAELLGRDHAVTYAALLPVGADDRATVPTDEQIEQLFDAAIAAVGGPGRWR